MARVSKPGKIMVALLALPVSLGAFISEVKCQPLTGGVEALEFNRRLKRSVPLDNTIAGFIDNSRVPLPESKSHVVGPEVFRAWIEKSQPHLMARLSEFSDDSVVEVAGRWDHADKTLANLGLPYRHLKARQLTAETLASTRILIINCAGELKRDKLQLVRDFVARGGYLLSTDWALDNMLTNTFPGTVAWNKGFNRKPIYEAHYVSPDPVLAPFTVAKAPWKMDQEAHLIKVLDRSRVRVLVSSPSLSLEDPDKEGVLACIFPFGKGYVLHMVGHFDNNARIAVGNFLPDSATDIGISLRQALAANFVAAALKGERPEPR
ncbi:MAG TPA: hypothetical protein PLC15_00500 [Candidatus Obscuribacter sp.]|nr:hypothetical protein [Candidatus Obscuribacter sp.]MBK9281945.1 hypothetical protein [Candidatus Obscuribacter sp.]HMW89468.1 hypothetical protein [Candidatus Obscuribacter sp.]HMX44555.1 hypothetical protein [Candidatus Obscuribacter sp.]HMY01987.1 hypothetical protein [Candidatus Obscuribacter sp.]